jgi:hypothetical protein
MYGKVKLKTKIEMRIVEEFSTQNFQQLKIIFRNEWLNTIT